MMMSVKVTMYVFGFVVTCFVSVLLSGGVFDRGRVNSCHALMVLTEGMHSMANKHFLLPELESNLAIKKATV